MSHGIHEIVYNAQNGLPWHKLGIPLDGLGTAREVFEKIPELEELIVKVPAEFEGEIVPGQFWIVRDQSRKILSHGTAGAEYEILQDADMVRMMARLVQEPNGPAFETAMLLWGGRKCVVQARIPEEIVVKGRNGQADVLHAYVVGSNGHDGQRAKFATGIRRVVCANTEAMFFNEAARNTSTWFVHSGDIEEKLGRVGDVLGFVRKDAAEAQKLFQKLANVELTQAQIDEVVKKLIPDTATKRAELQRERVLALHAGGKGNGPWQGTAWGLVNAFTELEDWTSGAGSKKPDADSMRANGILFGSIMDRKQAALAEVCRVAGLN